MNPTLLAEVRICAQCGWGYSGQRCAKCVDLARSAHEYAATMFSAGWDRARFAFSTHDPAVLAWRAEVDAELARLAQLRAQNAAISELQHQQRRAALYGSLPRG